MSVTIEKAREEDAEDLLAIQKQAFEELYMIYKDKQILSTLSEMKTKIARKDANYYKIFYNKELCGGVFVFKISDGIYKIGIMYIKPALQNKGIGSTAISLVEKTESDAKIWELDFPADREENKHRYEKLGYSDTGKRKIINDKLTLAFYRKQV